MLKTVLQKIGQHLQRQTEPNIKDMLSDSIVQAVMKADRINPKALHMELMSIARRISARRSRLEKFQMTSAAPRRVAQATRNRHPRGKSGCSRSFLNISN
jgi:hypothetical protein